MRILILTQWYPPEPALLMQELAQSLQALGHEVAVLTGFPNYPSGELYPGYHIKWRQKESLAGVPVIRVPLYPEHSRSGIKRVLNYASFALSCTLLGGLVVSKPDVLFVYHPPLTVGMPAFILSRLWRAPFVYQIQDMWPESLSASGMLDNQRILEYVGAFARWVYRRAAAVCVISPGFRANLIGKGVPPAKIHVISNWVDTEAYYPAPARPELAQRLGLCGKFNVMYAGNVGEGQGLETLVEAAQLLRDEPGIQFVVVGDGIALPQLRRATEGYGLDNVRFLGRFPSQDMPDLYALADVLLIHLKDDPLFRITIPHKVFAYMASGKPILAAVAGDAADIVTEVGAGITCPPGNPAAIAERVCAFSAMSDAQRRSMAARGLEAAQTTYQRTTLVKQIETVLLAVVQGNAQ